MGHSRGYRSGTRYMFKRPFGEKGRLPMTPYLRPVKMGDYVDIVANSAIHKGMPHKYYHGRTGIVYNVAKRAVGVEVNKVIRNRVEKKRVNIRIEHIRPSKCRTDFLARVKRVDQTKRDAKAKGIKVPIGLIKRFPVAPKAGYVVKASDSIALPMMRAASAFDDML